MADLSELKVVFPQVVEKRYLGQLELSVALEFAPALIRHLKTSFDFLVDLTAVDFPSRALRFDLIYILYSFELNERIRVRTETGGDAASIAGIFAGADWLEREVFDMFGIVFAGHPNLKRILLPEEWVEHPLRKEYPIAQPDDAWIAENLELL